MSRQNLRSWQDIQDVERWACTLFTNWENDQKRYNKRRLVIVSDSRPHAHGEWRNFLLRQHSRRR